MCTFFSAILPTERGYGEANQAAQRQWVADLICTDGTYAGRACDVHGAARPGGIGGYEGTWRPAVRSREAVGQPLRPLIYDDGPG